jgi:AcrR family transcriptional regulator
VYKSRVTRSRPPRRDPARGRRRTPPPGPEARERILGAALETFSQAGFDGTTTRELAARAGVNLGLIKYYFGSKEKLWKAAVDRAAAELREAVAAAAPATIDGRDDLVEIVRVCVRFAARNPAFIRLMNDEGKRDGPRMRWLVDRHGRPLYEMLQGLLAHGRSRGLVPEAEPMHLYYVLIGAIGMIFSQAPECRRITGVDPTASDTAIEAHAKLVARLVLGPGS